MGTLHFQSPGLLPADTPPASTPRTLQVRALLFYEGEHTSMEGRSKTYTAEELQKIVKATNTHLASGRRVKLYASDSDHRKISQRSTAGFLTKEPLTLAEITEADLPVPELVELVGKQGIFGTVQISGKDNVEQYYDGRLKELSIGLAPNYTVMEVSAVAMPSLAGAMLFSLPEQGEYTFALTLAEQLKDDTQRRLEQTIWQAWDAFMGVLSSIRDAKPEELGTQTPEDLKAQAIDDFANQLRTRLGVNSTPQPLPTIPVPTGSPSLSPVPLFGQPSMTVNTSNTSDSNTTPSTPAPASAEQFSQLQQQNRELEAKVAQMERERTTSRRFAQLKERAITLRDSGKITPAQFNDLFGKEDEALQRFAQPDNRELDQISFMLEQFEKYATPAEFGLPVNGQTPPSSPEQEEKEVKEFMESHTPRQIY